MEWCVGVRFRAHGNSKLGDKGEVVWSWDGKRWRGLFVLLRVVTEVYRHDERELFSMFLSDAIILLLLTVFSLFLRDT